MYKKLKTISFIVAIFMFIITIYCAFDSTEINAKENVNNEYSDTVYADVKGAVNEPGVYELDKGARVIDMIKAAGDLREDADTSIINLSKEVKDGMYIIVYTKDEIKAFKDKIIPSKKIIKEIENKIICPDTDNDACITSNDKVDLNEGLININEASEDELTSLSGIGSNKAKKIIEYRETNPFEKIEDIKNVDGIGDSLYEKIKDNITTE